MVLRVVMSFNQKGRRKFFKHGLQLVSDPADSKASVQQGHESSVPRPRGDIKGDVIRQRIHELFLSSLHLLRGPRFHDIPDATLDVIPYIFHGCGEPVCRLSSRRACERCVRPHSPVRPQCLLMLLCKHACCTSRSFPRPRGPCRCCLREREDQMLPL